MSKKKGAFASLFVPVEEQPYPIPENWCWIRLGNLCTDIQYGYTAKAIFNNNCPKMLRITDIQEGEVDWDSVPNCKIAENDFEKYKLVSNDIVFARTGATTGKSYLVFDPPKAVYASYLIRIRFHSSLNEKYVYYMLQSDIYWKQITELSSGIAQPGVNAAKLQSLVFPLSPIVEQKRIVDRIQSLFSKLDEAKEKAQAVVDGFELRKSAILHKAFTGELTERWRKEHGVELDGWEKLTLNDVAEYKKGPFGSSITKAMFVPKGENTYKVYEQGNAIRKTIEYGHYYISEQKYSELKGFAIKAGDIIISCAGTIGEVYKLPAECEAGVINQALMRVRLFSNINELFFIYYFGEILKGDIIDQANGTAIKNIPPFKVMKALAISLPTLSEQEEIVCILDNLLAQEEYAKDAAESVLEQIDIMKKAILARAFRGELGTNDPEEEWAGELVKEIPC